MDEVKDFISQTIMNKDYSYTTTIDVDHNITAEDIKYMWAYFKSTSDIFNDTYLYKRKMLCWISENMDKYDQNDDEQIILDFNGESSHIEKYNKIEELSSMYTAHTINPKHLIIYYLHDDTIVVQLHHNELWKKIYNQAENMIEKYYVYVKSPFWMFIADDLIDTKHVISEGRLLMAVYNFD